ncbi:MAG: transcriptional regulator [Caulobacteraceae bacterium]|nr:transcriptional regulator [Caulobacteraceae bacterium]
MSSVPPRGPTPPRDDVHALAEALRPALLRVSRHLRREALKAGVSALDAQLLTVIKKNPGIGGGELAELEQMTRPSMSSHLKRLEAAGWINRDPARAEDRRRVGVRLTAAGQAALATIRRRRNDWLAAHLAALSPEARAAIAAAAGALGQLAGDR